VKNLNKLSSLVIGGVALASITTRANTITPSLDTVVGQTWTYNMDFSSGELQAGDGFTIVDFNGYVAGSEFAPLNWSVALNPATAVGSPFGAPTLTTADTAAINLHFTYTGPTVEIASGPHLFVTGFGALSTSPLYAIEDWVSRDHVIGTIGVLGDGGIGSVHTDTIVVPAEVPDGGMTLALLGMGLVGLQGLRRKFSIA
jgi:hypothetical protein